MNWIDNAKEEYLKNVKNTNNLFFAKSHYTYEELLSLKTDIYEEISSFDDDISCGAGIGFADVGLGEESNVIAIKVRIENQEYIDSLYEKYGSIVHGDSEEFDLNNSIAISKE